MKAIDLADVDALPGLRLTQNETFNFRCHPDIECFNRCCRNLNLYLYPYDILRLKRSLNLDSDRFLERYAESLNFLVYLAFLLLTGLALAAAVARAAVLAGRFSRPIEALVADSDRISQGDLEPGRPIVTDLAEVHRLGGGAEHRPGEVDVVVGELAAVVGPDGVGDRDLCVGERKIDRDPARGVAQSEAFDQCG